MLTAKAVPSPSKKAGIKCQNKTKKNSNSDPETYKESICVH